MSERMAEKSCIEFTQMLASKAPVPGGGGVAALVGAFGTALCSMVGNLTVGHKKYAAVEADVCNILEKAKDVQARMLELVDKDARAFKQLSEAYAISKDDPRRAQVIDNATYNACVPPFEMMKCCCEALDLLEEMLDKGNTMLVSDVGCGALCCKAALAGASLNIFVNIKLLKDKSQIIDMEAETDEMLNEYCPRADRITDEVSRRLGREV